MSTLEPSGTTASIQPSTASACANAGAEETLGPRSATDARIDTIRRLEDAATIEEGLVRPAFALTEPGRCEPLSVAELRCGVRRPAVPGLQGDLARGDDLASDLGDGLAPCVRLGLMYSYLIAVHVPDSAGDSALEAAFACAEAMYAERLADGAGTNVFFFGLHALDPGFQDEAPGIDMTRRQRWESPDGRYVVLNGWVEVTGEEVPLPDDRDDTCEGLLAEIGHTAAVHAQPPAAHVPRVRGGATLALNVASDLDRWGKGPEDYRGDRSSHDMAACGRAAWYLRSAVGARMDVSTMSLVVASGVRLWLRDRGLDRDKYDELRSGLPYLLATAVKAVASQQDDEGRDDNRYRRSFVMPEQPEEGDAFGLLRELARLGANRAALDAARYVVFERRGIEVDQDVVDAAACIVPADDAVPERTRRVLSGCAESGVVTDYARRLGEAAIRRAIARIDSIDLDVEDAAVVAQAVIESHECLRAIGWGMRDTEREIERILRIHGIDYAYQRPGGDCE